MGPRKSLEFVEVKLLRFEERFSDEIFKNSSKNIEVHLHERYSCAFFESKNTSECKIKS